MNLLINVTNGQQHPSLTRTQRAEHSISRRDISEAALKVLYRLDQAGHRACLVGGGVRDLLLGKHPKDFDVATSATPEQVQSLFKNCRLIGRRFRLAHIRFGREIVEVATFRQHSAEAHSTELNEHGRLLRDNTFGSIEEDAQRRDFSINALYYDISDFSILDYADGLKDLNSRTLRLIGDPETRYREDPVRMLRAIRFAAKLDFDIEPEAAQAILHHGHLLKHIPPARLFDETLKLFHSGSAMRSFELLRKYGLFAYLFPKLDHHLKSEPLEAVLDFLDQALVNTDTRAQQNKPLSPAFIFAVLLWPLVHQRTIQLQSKELAPAQALQTAGSEIFSDLVKTIAVPRRFSQISRTIWNLQPRFSNTRGKQPQRLLGHPNFRAAYDFFCIQSMVGLASWQLCQMWTELQQEKPAAIDAPKSVKKNSRRRRPRRRKNPGANAKTDAAET